MKFYSETLNRFYDTAGELEKEEKKYTDLQSSRREREKEVEKAYQHYIELKRKFLNDFNSSDNYKYTLGFFL